VLIKSPFFSLGELLVDQNISLARMMRFLNITKIEIEVRHLLMISEISVHTIATLAPEPFQKIAEEKGHNYLAWASKVEQFLKAQAFSFWGRDYSVRETNDYLKEIDLFIAVIYGEEKSLPWSATNAGLTHFATNTSEVAGLSVITMNYQNIVNNSEGLTLTTLHEIGHLFGLVHPQDYWNPYTSQVEDSWIWGYVPSPMTYLLSYYQFDYFDRLQVWRVQIDSLLNSMSEYRYEEEAINRIRMEMKDGKTLSFEDELVEAKEAFLRYKDHVTFHYLSNALIMSGVGLSVILLTTLVIQTYRKTRERGFHED
jgi:hypothetical protein